MSKNNLQVYLHIVFATKNRNPDIIDKIEKPLFNFIWNIIIDKQCIPLMINGMPDHIHILLKMDSKIALSNLMKHIKGKSSRFLNENYQSMHHFQWQRGYAAFSVSMQNVDLVLNYIKNQKQHHKNDSLNDAFEL